MKIVYFFLKFVMVAATVVVIPLALYITYYNWEIWQIERELDFVENSEVLTIWGHDDVKLEEISARVKVGSDKIIVLNNLSKDVNAYPEHVMISEIGGLSFQMFTCGGSTGISQCIDIGSESNLGETIGIKFNAPSDVLKNFDAIYKVISSMNRVPKHNYMDDGNNEVYLFINNTNTADEDPIYRLQDADAQYQFAKTLEWKNEECFK